MENLCVRATTEYHVTYTQISVQSLMPADHEWWGEKVGGSIKSWKKRYFVLKDRKIWYFSNVTSSKAKGCIVIEPGAEVREVSYEKIAKYKAMAISIGSRNRKFAFESLEGTLTP